MIVTLEPSEYPWNLFFLADLAREAIDIYINDAIVLAYKDRDSVDGVVVTSHISAHTWEIKNLAVTPTSQGKGLGKALLQAALETCRNQGAHEVWIGTGNSSINQLGLYQKMGFRVVEIDRGFFERTYNEEIIENGLRCRDMVRLVYTINPRGSA
jgi:ribosomal protein S18 acetylase RimI-like enzyme